MLFRSPRPVSEKVEIKPPVSNTGAIDTISALTVAPDWFSLTFPARVPVSDIKRELCRQFPTCEPQDLPFGGKGYPSQTRIGSSRVLYGGSDVMGSHVELSGEAIRSCRDLYDFLAYAYESSATCSRLDIACDDRGLDLLVIDRFAKSADENAQLGAFRRYRRILEKSCKGEVLADGINFGSRNSEVYCRIYDKALEQNSKLKLIADSRLPAGSWIRMEFELADKNATQAFYKYVESGFKNLVSLLGGYISRFLSFRIASDDTNRSRWAVAPWWSAIVDALPKAFVLIERVKLTLRKKAMWFQTSCSKSLAILLKSPYFGVEWLRDLVAAKTLELTTAEKELSLECPWEGLPCES